MRGEGTSNLWQLSLLDRRCNYFFCRREFCEENFGTGGRVKLYEVFRFVTRVAPTRRFFPCLLNFLSWAVTRSV